MDPFPLKLGLSFLVGGAWIAGTTMAAERFGPRLGGWIGGLPSTVVVSMLFIGWTQGEAQVHAATEAFPLTMAVNAVYLIVYVLILRRGLAVAIGGALLIWAGLQTMLILANPERFAWSLAGWALTLGIAYCILRHLTANSRAERVLLHYSPSEVAWRAAFGGAAISLAVVLSKIGGPIFGSVFASFPAVFTSTLVIAAHTAGHAFTRSLVTPLLVSAEVNVVVYALALRLTVMSCGILGASAAAYLVSLGSATLTFYFLRWQHA